MDRHRPGGYFRGSNGFGFREISVKASVNGIEINYEVSGTEGKPWIVFSHALCNNLTLWDDQAALLNDDYRVLRYDHRGLGQSSAPEGPYSFPMIIADALALMDEHLATREWFVGRSITLADIALYAYTHVAEAGGFRLRDRTHVCRWLDRVAALPRYAPMD